MEFLKRKRLAFIKICWSCNDGDGMHAGEKGLWLQNLINLQADPLSQLNLTYQLQILVLLIFLSDLSYFLNAEGLLYFTRCWCVVFFPQPLVL